METNLDIAFVKVRGTVYLKREDVASYIEEIASTEPNDTEERLMEAAKILRGVAPLVEAVDRTDR